MPLSVADSPNGSGLSNLLRQTRPGRTTADAGSASANEVPSTVARSAAGAAIDSTGSRSAQIKATLTVVLGRLGGEPASETLSTKPVPKPASASRSTASDLLRVLDAYSTDPLRRSA